MICIPFQNVPIQQDAAETLVKVLAKSSDGLLENVEGGGAILASRALILHVVLEDLVHGVGVREGNELLVLGNILPIVDQERLELVGNDEPDRRSGVERVLLFPIYVSVIVEITCLSELAKREEE